MTTSVDWKSVGLFAGSNKYELDWNDWKRPVSLLGTKSLWNRTSAKNQFSGGNHIMTPWRFSHEIRNGSIEKNKKRILPCRTLEIVEAYCLSILRGYQADYDEEI